jgi:hypothetical protein
MMHVYAVTKALSPMKTACLEAFFPTGTHVALMNVDNVQNKTHILSRRHIDE